MTLVASASILPPFSQMEDQMSRAHSVRSNSSGHSFNLGYIHEELDEIEENNTVYVAVPKEMQYWLENLKWLLKSIDNNLQIVFLHVHKPAQKIATPIGYMPASGLEQHELRAHRQLEHEEMNKCLKSYVDICAKKNFKATTLSTDNDDIARGLLELVKQHKVTNLVMGAGSARTFSIMPHSRTREIKPKSKIALAVREKAELSCRIRFISKGELICIREPSQNAPDASNLSTSSSSSSSDHSRPSRSQSMPPIQPNKIVGPPGLDHKSRSVNVVACESFPSGSLHPSYYSEFENPYPRSSSSSSHYQNLFSEVDNCSLISDSLTATHLKDSPSSFHDVTEEIYTRLEEAMTEAKKFKQEAYEESNRRNKAERDLLQANKQLEKHRKMYEQAKNKLMKTKELLSSLYSQNALLTQTISELQSVSPEERAPIREAQAFKQHGSSSVLVNCTEFTYSEIKVATNNFDPSHKIGEGGFGVVYRGFLRHTRVAIKILSRDSIQGDPQFFQEIEILSRIRHPHLVTLMGACLEARALVYELLVLGSLDKHLTYKYRNRPLSWQDRVRVAREICSALIFLHSSHVVHGDLKPENVLLDSSFTVKLSDFGICRQVHMTNITTTPHHITDQPKGTFPYMDPEYLGSGELTPQYDVFSFGIVLLQLVTGKEAMKLKNDVENACDNRQIEKMVDQSAGWPLEQAMRMIQIGLRCSDASRKKRPDLGKDVWGLLESIANVTSASMRSSLTRPTS